MTNVMSNSDPLCLDLQASLRSTLRTARPCAIQVQPRVAKRTMAYEHEHQVSVELIESTGCPFHCSFCFRVFAFGGDCQVDSSCRDAIFRRIICRYRGIMCYFSSVRAQRLTWCPSLFPPSPVSIRTHRKSGRRSTATTIRTTPLRNICRSRKSSGSFLSASFASPTVARLCASRRRLYRYSFIVMGLSLYAAYGMRKGRANYADFVPGACLSSAHCHELIVASAARLQARLLTSSPLKASRRLRLLLPMRAKRRRRRRLRRLLRTKRD